MATKLTASMPADLTLGQLFTLEWAALDPDTGEDVPGVVISQTGLLVTQLAGAADQLAAGQFIPLLTPVSLDDQEAS